MELGSAVSKSHLIIDFRGVSKIIESEKQYFMGFAHPKMEKLLIYETLNPQKRSKHTVLPQKVHQYYEFPYIPNDLTHDPKENYVAGKIIRGLEFLNYGFFIS